MIKKFFAIFILGAMIANGCMFIPDKPAKVYGSGNVVSENRAVSGITSIDLEGSADVHVKFGASESLVISGEDNVIFLIETNVEDHQLIIKTKPLMTYSATKPVEITVTVTTLDDIAISGSGNLDVSGYSGNSLRLALPGSGNLIAEGSTNNVDITVIGSGNVYADQLVAKSANVAMSGSGRVTVFASDSLTASVNGSGSIEYLGSPVKVSQQVTGSGTIQKK